MPINHDLTFGPVETQRLFGHEAAENEAPERLKEYYFKNITYQDVTAPLGLRILVGHKGIGKSALFKIAIMEDRQNSELPILIRPDDIAELGKDTTDFLLTVRSWKDGLKKIIAAKALSEFGLDQTGATRALQTSAARVVDFLAETLRERLKIDTSLGKNALISQFLKNNRIKVYIDDLDRGWEGSKDDVRRISALLNAARDLLNESPNLFIKIGLRSDVYYLVRTSDESTDKIEGSVVWQRWRNHEILVLLVKRVETFFGRAVDESRLLGLKQYDLSQYLSGIMSSTFQGEGHWANAPTYRVIMSLIRKWPRYLVKLCTLAAKDAFQSRKNIIGTANFRNIFTEYSEGRIQDTINEYRSELPDIERLVMAMKPSKREKTTKEGYVYSSDALLQKIRNIRPGGTFRFAGRRETTDATDKELAAFLYKVNFLTARKELADGTILRRFFEESRYLSSILVDFGFDWEVHPAYRWALQPDSIETIFAQLKLTSDDER
jgi:hypothetical protein